MEGREGARKAGREDEREGGREGLQRYHSPEGNHPVVVAVYLLGGDVRYTQR